MSLFDTQKRERQAKEFKRTVAKGKKDYKNKKSSATAVSGTMQGKQVNTMKSVFTETEVGKPKNVKLKGGTPYNEDMSNRIQKTTTKKAPDYNSKPKVNDTTEVKQHSVPADTERDLNKAKDKGKSNARKAFEMAQGLLDRSRRKYK